jgi:hypothetical protein
MRTRIVWRLLRIRTTADDKRQQENEGQDRTSGISHVVTS